jgi:hypothetical protein
MVHEASTATPERALEMLTAIEARRASRGLTLAGIVDDALNPQRRLARMPTDVLSKKTWRSCVVYLLTRRDELPAKDERHLRVCFTQTSWLKTWQMRWIYDIVSRMEPAGCGTWGAPE